MHALIAIALIVPPVAGPDPLCAEVARLVAAAREGQPFESMFAAKAEPKLLPAGGCFRTHGERWFCHQNLLPSEITHDRLGARIAACLPGAAVSTNTSWRGIRQTIVKGDGVMFDLEESGSDRGKVGRSIRIEISALR